MPFIQVRLASFWIFYHGSGSVQRDNKAKTAIVRGMETLKKLKRQDDLLLSLANVLFRSLSEEVTSLNAVSSGSNLHLGLLRRDSLPNSFSVVNRRANKF